MNSQPTSKEKSIYEHDPALETLPQIKARDAADYKDYYTNPWARCAMEDRHWLLAEVERLRLCESRLLEILRERQLECTGRRGADRERRSTRASAAVRAVSDLVGISEDVAMVDEVEQPTPDQVTYPPSYFANLGQPMCSCWGKSEVEWIALAYVQALAADGDTWKKLSRKRAYDLLTDEQRRHVHGMLTFKDDLYERWFESVSDRLKDSAGAFSVRGFWWGPR